MKKLLLSVIVLGNISINAEMIDAIQFNKIQINTAIEEQISKEFNKYEIKKSYENIKLNIEKYLLKAAKVNYTMRQDFNINLEKYLTKNLQNNDIEFLKEIIKNYLLAYGYSATFKNNILHIQIKKENKK